MLNELVKALRLTIVPAPSFMSGLVVGKLDSLAIGWKPPTSVTSSTTLSLTAWAVGICASVALPVICSTTFLPVTTSFKSVTDPVKPSNLFNSLVFAVTPSITAFSASVKGFVLLFDSYSVFISEAV